MEAIQELFDDFNPSCQSMVNYDLI